MPIPKPNEGEKRQDFIDRCMGNETMKEDYPETDQRLAICYRSWREEHGDSQDMKNFSHNSTVADSEPSWGNVDKSSLPRMAFADEGEPGKKSTWGYPHHWVSGGSKGGDGIYTSGTMYLHKGGLNAAWAAANGARSGQESSSAIKDHLEAHREALGLEDEENDQDIFRGFSVKAQATDAEIYLYDEIGSGWFGGVSANIFKDELSKLGKIKNITLRINSPGGDVFDGIAIYNLLKQNQAHITVYVDGLAASIASIIAMAGDTIKIAENAMMMIHNPWTMAVGNANDMRDIADRLEKVGGQLIATYAKRTGMDEQEIADLMEKETWMTAEEAMDWGFVDSMVESLKMAAHFDLKKFKFKNMPQNPIQEMHREPPSPRIPMPDSIMAESDDINPRDFWLKQEESN